MSDATQIEKLEAEKALKDDVQDSDAVTELAVTELEEVAGGGDGTAVGLGRS